MRSDENPASHTRRQARNVFGSRGRLERFRRPLSPCHEPQYLLVDSRNNRSVSPAKGLEDGRLHRRHREATGLRRVVAGEVWPMATPMITRRFSARAFRLPVVLAAGIAVLTLSLSAGPARAQEVRAGEGSIKLLILDD